MRRPFVPCCLVALLAACDSRVTATNPYDPQTAASAQARGTIGGRVVLPPEVPAARRAQVTVHLRSGASSEGRTASVDDGGASRFVELPAGAHQVWAELPGLSSERTTVVLGIGEGAELGEVFLLGRYGAVDDTIHLEGAEDHSGTRLRSVETGAMAETGPDGRFRLVVLAFEHTLEILPPPGHELPPDLPALRLTVRADESAPLPLRGALTLPARALFTVSGTLRSPLDIRDWPDRALVRVVGDGVDRLATVANEDGAGRFEVGALLPGAYRVSARVRGHEDAEAALEVGDADRALEPIFLRPLRPALMGRAVDPTGAPVADALVRARRGQVVAGADVTDAEGAFALALTPESHTLFFEHAAFEPLQDQLVDWDDVEGFTRPDGAGEFVMQPRPVAVLATPVVSGLGPLDDWPARATGTLFSEASGVPTRGAACSASRASRPAPTRSPCAPKGTLPGPGR